MDIPVAQDIRIVRGNPTPDELAAVTAVIEGMVQESEGTRAKKTARAASAWESSQRPIRTPIIPGITRWRDFH